MAAPLPEPGLLASTLLLPFGGLMGHGAEGQEANPSPAVWVIVAALTD